MTNNSEVYWDVQTVDNSWFSLHTYAWSVRSSGGRRFQSPAKRGEDLQLPHRRGRLYIPKTRESQLYDLNMWVFPTNADGSKDPDKTIPQKAHENWRKIIAALDQEGQFRLRKRWYDDSSTKATPVVRTAVALVEYVEGAGPDTDDGRSYEMTVTLTLADPYFYEEETASESFGSMDPAQGEVPTTHVTLTLPAGATATFSDGNWITNEHSASVVIDCNEATAKDGSTYVNGRIKRNPAFMNWPTLTPGTTISGSGSVQYEPAYR